MTVPGDTRLREAEKQLSIANDAMDSAAVRAIISFIEAVRDADGEPAGGVLPLEDAHFGFVVVPEDDDTDVHALMDELSEPLSTIADRGNSPLAVYDDDSGTIDVALSMAEEDDD